MLTPVTEEEVAQVLRECLENIAKGESKFPNMSYEQGILNALRWLFDEDEQPMSD